MASLSQLKVDELRAELAQRGLNTSGTKPTLVRRLQSATRKEEKNKQSTENNNNDSVNRKRQRDDENEDGDCANGHGSDKIKATEDFRKMGIKELREQSSLRGILTTGSKKELLERLCNDAEKKPSSLVDDENSLQEENKEEKLVTATKKGAAVLDQWMPDDIKSTYHVLQDGDDIYDATLNQTNVGDNNNKFYIIQVLESDGGGRYMLFNRWGRVGSKGQQKLNGPYTSKHSATAEFETKFYDKTRNNWCDRQNFVAHPKRYTWLEMDYSKTDQQSSAQEAHVSKVGIQPRETKLEARVAKFISLICNISMMRQQMIEIGYNAEKLPLGKLSKSTILRGYDVLKRIADVIGQKDRKMLEQLSG